MYRQISNLRHSLVGNKTIDHSDVVGASPVGAAPTTSSFSTYHLASINCTDNWLDLIKNTWIWGFGASYIRDLTVVNISQGSYKYQ